VGLVIVLLATVPVLVPLLVTRDDGVVAVAPAGLAAAPGVPALPRSAPGAGAPEPTTTVAPIPPAGPLAGTTAPAPAPTTPTTSTRAAPPPAAPEPAPSSAASPPSSSAPPPTTLAAAPDLLVVAASWSPAQPAAGQPVIFTAVVANAGSEATPAVTQGVGFAVDGTPVSWSSGDSTPLAPGEQRIYTADGGPAGATWTATAGEHELQAYADDVNRIAETDDGNNALTVPLPVP
jgi:hypothetical protein